MRQWCWIVVLFLAGVTPSCKCQTSVQSSPPGIDFGGAHLTLGMAQSKALALINDSGLYKAVPMRGTPDGLSFEVRRSDGGDQGAVIFSANHLLKQAMRTWDAPESFYEGMRLITKILNHLKDEGFSDCIVSPGKKNNAPDLRDGDDTFINCGEKFIEISAYAYKYEERQIQTVEITEEIYVTQR